MATTYKHLQGWQVITTDEQGNITTGERRRSRKAGGMENVYIQRINDGVSLGRGNSVVMHDSVTKTYSVYLIHEIRKNTLNNVIEIWAFSYLRWFELKPIPFYKQFLPRIVQKDKSIAYYRDRLLEEIDKNELYLTAELSEIWLKDFICLAEVYDEKDWRRSGFTPQPDKDFLVRFVCEPSAENFVLIDIFKEIKTIQIMEPKASEEHLKKITVSTNKAKYNFHKMFGKDRQAAQSSEDESDNVDVDSTNNNKKEMDDQKSLFLNESDSDNDEKVNRSLSSGKPSQTKNNISSDNGSVTPGKLNIPTKATNGNLPDDNTEYGASKPNSQTVTEPVDTKDEEVEKQEVHEDAEEEGEEDEEEDEDDEEEEEEDDDGQIYSSRAKRKAALRRDALTKKKKLTAEVTDGESDDKSEEMQTDDNANEDNSSSDTDLDSNPKIPTKDDKEPVTSKDNGKMDKKLSLSAMKEIKKKYLGLKQKFGAVIDNDNKTPLNNLPTSNGIVDVAMLESKLRQAPATKHKTIYSKLIKELEKNKNKSVMDIVQEAAFSPSRTKEFARIYLELFDSINKFETKIIHICGKSGSGKTVITEQIINELTNSRDNRELPFFKVLKLNGNSINKELYTSILRQMQDEDMATYGNSASETALRYYFNNFSKSKRRQHLLLIDDVEILLNKDADLLDNIFQWSSSPQARLVTVILSHDRALVKNNYPKQMLNKLNYLSMNFDDYSTTEIRNVINYRLKTLSGQSRYKISKNSPNTLEFTKLYHDMDSSSGENDMTVVRLNIDPAIIDEALKQICLINTDVIQAIKTIDIACGIAMNEFVTENANKSINSIPKEKQLTLETIMQALKTKNHNIEMVNKINELPNFAKLFLYSFQQMSILQEASTLNPIEVWINGVSLLHKNKDLTLFKSMRQSIIPDSDYKDINTLRFVNRKAIEDELVEMGILKRVSAVAVSSGVSLRDLKNAIDWPELQH